MQEAKYGICKETSAIQHEAQNKVYDVRTRRSLLIMTCHFMTVLYKFVIKGFRTRAKGAILDLVNKIWMEYRSHSSKKY